MPTVTKHDFIESFGARSLSRSCVDLIKKNNFNYKVLKGIRRDKVLLKVLKKLKHDNQVIGAKERRGVWDKGWAENLNDFVKSGYNLKMLVPRFIRPKKIVRYKQDYILPANPYFELDYYSVFRQWLFETYFKDFENIYEFGCGTGFNLVALAQLYPDKNLYGTDFVKSSIDLVNLTAKTHNIRLKGSIFDMISPDKSFRLKENSLIFSIGSIEQLAGKFEDFLQYLLGNHPGLCVHVEPIVELYDEKNLIDYLAIKFQGKRGYTYNFFPRLRELEKEAKIEILKVKRLFFGSLYMEGYNLIVWRPVK